MMPLLTKDAIFIIMLPGFCGIFLTSILYSVVYSILKDKKMPIAFNVIAGIYVYFIICLLNSDHPFDLWLQ